jgi:ubiquinone/menaquinone biosynthesis C-methylase UbiE
MKKATDTAEFSYERWEAAYLRFETPRDEIRKFTRRLKRLGALAWSHNASVLELFCGQGSGLRALQSLGFSRICGLDRSETLLQRAGSVVTLVAADARELPFRDRCKDVVIIQGGLHHLHTLPNDLEITLHEIQRVLKLDGKLIIVEPWLTPFLSLVHAVCKNRLATGIYPKLKSLADMIENERPTYEQWLSQPQMILDLLDKHFITRHCSYAMGKLYFVGQPHTKIIYLSNEDRY